MLHRTLALVILLSLHSLPFRAQQQPPSFKVQVNYVEVTVRVTDAQAHFVGDLRKDEFRLLEDGAPQTIADFSRVAAPAAVNPAAAGAWSRTEPDIQSNAAPFDGRLYVLVLDDIHVAAAQTVAVRRAAKLFLEQYFQDGDMGAVVNTSGSADPAQELTPSRVRLLAAVDRFAGHKGDVSVAGGRSALVEDVLSSLWSITNLLDGVRGRRKAVVFFSEGPGVRFETSRSAVMRNVAQAQDVVAAAARANVTIYSLDPRGLVAPEVGTPESAVAQLPGRNATPAAAGVVNLDSGPGIDSLRNLSEGTGGFAFVNTNNIQGVFERIREENSAYYVLGYYAPEGGKDGALRKIEVVTTREGLKVQARQGYAVPRVDTRPTKPPAAGDTRSPALRTALDSVLPVTGLRISGLAVPFRGTDKSTQVIVAVHVDGRDLAFTAAEGGTSVASFELALATMNSRGEAGASHYEVVTLPLKGATLAGVRRDGLRVTRTLSLKRGRYQLRVGVVDRGSERRGAIHCDIEASDFDSLPLSMSGLLLTSSLAGRVSSAPGGPMADLPRLLPGPPAMTREFRAGEQLALYAELYGTRSRVPGLQVVVSVVDVSGQEAYRQPLVAAANGVLGIGGIPVVEVRHMLPLQTLQPGRYVLRVEAGRDQTGSVKREVPFTIVP